MSLIRILRTAQSTISHTFEVDEVATDATGSVTYSVNRLDGTLIASGTATHPGAAGLYQFVLPPQALIDLYTVDWSGTLNGGAITVRDYVEIVGGFICSLGEIRNAKPAIAIKYTSADLIAARLEAEMECEDICGKAFVPRFARVLVDGNNDTSVVLPNVEVRKVRAGMINNVALSAGDLANIYPSQSGVLFRRAGIWPYAGYYSATPIILEIEHGLDFPPEYVKRAVIIRARNLLTSTDGTLAHRATTFSTKDGGTYTFAPPSGDKTGIPVVDAAYERATEDGGGFA